MTDNDSMSRAHNDSMSRAVSIIIILAKETLCAIFFGRACFQKVHNLSVCRDCLSCLDERSNDEKMERTCS